MGGGRGGRSGGGRRAMTGTQVDGNDLLRQRMEAEELRRIFEPAKRNSDTERRRDSGVPSCTRKGHNSCPPTGEDLQSILIRPRSVGSGILAKLLRKQNNPCSCCGALMKGRRRHSAASSAPYVGRARGLALEASSRSRSQVGRLSADGSDGCGFASKETPPTSTRRIVRRVANSPMKRNRCGSTSKRSWRPPLPSLIQNGTCFRCGLDL